MLAISPSEVRNMTPHEIMAVLRYKTQGATSKPTIDYDELLDDLRKAKSK
jgi:hypothetical protein